MSASKKTICIIGEVLVDFVSTEAEVPLKDCMTFRRQVGGSCANVARFLAALGTGSRFISAIGNDGLGDFLYDYLDKAGVDCTHLERFDFSPTSSVVVNKTSATPQYVPYIGAHSCIDDSHINEAALSGADVLHTNGFSLACNPMRDTIVRLIKKAHGQGIKISFDPNWRERLWPDREAATKTIQEIASMANWMKPSLDDAEELFGQLEPEELAQKYREWGAKTVVLTLGAKGSLVVDAHGAEQVEPKGKLKCATGAGDAFWSLFLHNSIQGKAPVEAAERASSEIVELLEKQTVS